MRLVTYKVVCKQKTGIPRRCKVATWHRRGPPGHHLRVEARRRVVQVTYRDSGLPARLGRPGSFAERGGPGDLRRGRGPGSPAPPRTGSTVQRRSGREGAGPTWPRHRETPLQGERGAHQARPKLKDVAPAGQTRLGHAPSIHFFLGRYNECLLSSNIYNQYILLRATFKLPYCKTTQRPINSFS